MVEIDFWRQLLAYLDSSSKLGPEILNILKRILQNQRMLLHAYLHGLFDVNIA